MTMYYLDTSALLPYYRSEPATQSVKAFLTSQRRPVLISALTKAEMASALSRWLRMDELDESDCGRIESAFHEDLAAGRMSVVPVGSDRFDRAVHWLLSRSTALRTLDALHLACAEAEEAVLVTLDERFAEAAAHLGVRTHVPD